MDAAQGILFLTIAAFVGILATIILLAARGRRADEVEESSRLLAHGLAAAQSTPSEQAARREQAVLLANALERLPEHQRLPLVLLLAAVGLSLAGEIHRRAAADAGLPSPEALRARMQAAAFC